MYPNNVNSQEPLARDLAMKAAARERRRAGLGSGMLDTIQPMDNLSAQAMMDDMQAPAPAMPSRPSAPIRLASVRDTGMDESPAPVMTAQFRRGGAQPIAQPKQQCRPGDACYRGGAPALSNPYNLMPGETLLAIDGVPVNGAAPMTPAAPMTAPAPKVASSQPMPSSPAAQRPLPTPQQLLDEAGGFLSVAESQFGSVAGAANNTILGRLYTETALQMLGQDRELSLLERQQTEQELMNKKERETQDVNIANAKENSIRGYAQALDNIMAGIGEYANLDSDAREEVAYQAILSKYASSGLTKEPDRAWIKGQITGHEIGRLIAREGTIRNGQWQYEQGNLEGIDDVAAAHYYGAQDKKTGQLIIGEPLRHKMHRELDTTVARHIESRILALSPKMDPRDAARLALDRAYDAVDVLSDVANGVQLQYLDGGAFQAPLNNMDEDVRMMGDQIRQE